MKLYYPISVDFYKIYPLPIMPAQEANIGRGALVTLTANSAAVVPEDELVNIYVKKPDGTKVYADCTVSGNQIQVDFSQQMLLVPGMLEVELQMVDTDGNNITTPIFLIQNQRSNIDYSAITSQDEFSALVNALAEVEDLKKNGLKGDAATVTVGSTTTGDPGTDAAVSNSGTTGDAVLNFTIPRGADGSMWYYGDAITGNSTSGTVFAESGITSANMGDKYLNTSSGADKGNVYTCTVAGDAETAQWVYIGNIEGPQGPEGPAGMQEITFAARSAFPESGQENMLYIDNTVNPALAYIWNGSDYIPAGGGGEITAADVNYSNTSSGLTADNVQAAIDENAEAISALNSRIEMTTQNLAEGVFVDYNAYMVTVKFYMTSKTYTSDTWNTIAVIPEKLRPASVLTFAALNNNVSTDATNTPVWVRVTTDGNLQVYVFSDRASVAPVGVISYVI